MAQFNRQGLVIRCWAAAPADVKHKESVVRSLIKRGETFSTSEGDRLVETKRINRALKMNNYPRGFIHTTRRKMARTRNKAAGEQREQKPLVVLPYVQGVTVQKRLLVL